MCSPVPFEIIKNLEDMLMFGPQNPTSVSDIKVYKAFKNRELADYICYASNRQCALEASKIWESKCVEKMPWIKNYIEVTVSPHGFNVSLSRQLCFRSGLQDVNTTSSSYGNNSIFSSKVFDISVVETTNPISLTSLRMDLVNEVMKNIIQACGGTCHNGEANVTLRISNTNQQTKQNVNYINLIIGPVVCHSSDKKSLINSNSYRRLRMDDISQMCENKLDLNDRITFEDKDKLLQATTVFDFLQSNVWRAITLRLIEEQKHEKSSCKGAMFVLYNYARLFSLCSQFDEKVIAAVYPPLPGLNEVDFSLLRQEEEWKLMFQSILSWPAILRKAVLELESGKPKIHLIFEFLRTTSSNFSHYYHRTKIFTEPRTHLLPVLFARIYLLKGLLKVFEIVFKIVCISPLNKM